MQERALTLVNESQGRKHAETRLRQSDEIFRLLVSSVKDYAIFLLDEDGRGCDLEPGSGEDQGLQG